jgi:hypothetical protein
LRVGGGRSDVEECAGCRDVLGAVGVGKEPVVADAVEALGQDMHQEPPDELVRLERHGLVAAGSLDPVVLVAERYAGRVGGDEAAVGDRDPVGVAGQIGQHLLRPGERPLAIDEPPGPMQRRETDRRPVGVPTLRLIPCLLAK